MKKSGILFTKEALPVITTQTFFVSCDCSVIFKIAQPCAWKHHCPQAVKIHSQMPDIVNVKA